MKIFFNGWFSGFIDNTNPGLQSHFFLKLFEKVYEEKIEIGDFKNSDILCEFDMLIGVKSCVKRKKWKNTFLYSGESYLKQRKDIYDCVLWVERNNHNVVNLPLFIAYLYTNNFVNRLEERKKIDRIPSKDVCVVISNPGGTVRNNFLKKLERHFKVDYLGSYKNNKPKINESYNTQTFINRISEYKFIVSMENSREDTYITERIIHGLLANTIPIYWGSLRVNDYFNLDRIINYQENDNIFEEINNIRNNEKLLLEKINQNIFPNNKLTRTLENIANDIKNILNKSKWNHVSKIYTISSPNFEPERYTRLNKMFFDGLKLKKELIKFICPTYKHTISDTDMVKYVKKDLVLKLRPNKMKKSEVSLTLNFKAVLEDIEKNYKDGIFIIFESDVRPLENIEEINNFFNTIYEKKNHWDMIHFGGEDHGQLFDTFNFGKYKSPYRNANEKNKFIESKLGINRQKKFIEDITNSNHEIRLIRKLNTRCTDTLVFTYSGVIKMLNHFRKDTNYGSPMDYYIINFLENNLDFKFYWSNKTYFLQRSAYKEEPSTIQ